MKFQTRKVIAEGEMIPRGYGIAYRDFIDYTRVCYPLPLNWIVRGWTAVAKFLKLPPMTEWEQNQADLAQQQYQKGKQAGYSEAVRMIDERIRTIVDNKLIKKLLSEEQPLEPGVERAE